MVKKALPSVVTIELSRFILALPLAQMNLRTGLLGGVTASNVSEYGGGFCISRGLTPMGVHAASCEVRGDVPDVDDHVQTLTSGLFDGIGALRVHADVLKLPMAGHVSAELSKEGCRVLESNFPDSLHMDLGGDGEAIGCQVQQRGGCVGWRGASMPGGLRTQRRSERSIEGCMEHM